MVNLLDKLEYSREMLIRASDAEERVEGKLNKGLRRGNFEALHVYS